MQSHIGEEQTTPNLGPGWASISRYGCWSFCSGGVLGAQFKLALLNVDRMNKPNKTFGLKKKQKKTKRNMKSQESTPPYSNSARFADNMCYAQYSASLKCLESTSEKSKCQEQFDVYKECKKKEREARLERNRNRSLFS